MTMPNHIADEDLVLFALQLLPEDRMRAAREHIESCDACREELARLQGDLAAYAMTSEIQVPPAAARERLMRQVAKEPKPVPAPVPVQQVAETRPVADRSPNGEPVFAARQSRGLSIESQEERRPSRAPWILAWTGWAVAAGCSFVAGLQFHQRQQVQSSLADQQAQMERTSNDAARAQDALATLTAANARQVALHLQPVSGAKPPAAPAANAPEALAAYLADKGALVFVATHLQPVPTGKTYELWLLPADGSSPVPAGTFRPDAEGSARVVLPRLPKGVPAKGFGVTIENDGGSPAPTLPIVMAGS